jgi:hypothetical protein
LGAASENATAGFGSASVAATDATDASANFALRVHDIGAAWGDGEREGGREEEIRSDLGAARENELNRESSSRRARSIAFERRARDAGDGERRTLTASGARTDRGGSGSGNVKITSPFSETRFALGASSDARARTRTTRHRALDATRRPREIFSDATGADVGDAIADMFATRAMLLHALLADAIRGARRLEDARAGRRARSPREEVRGFFPSVSACAGGGTLADSAPARSTRRAIRRYARCDASRRETHARAVDARRGKTTSRCTRRASRSAHDASLRGAFTRVALLKSERQ